MSHQQSPFAALTGAEKQIKWLEYQSIRLPYVQNAIEQPAAKAKPATAENLERTYDVRVKIHRSDLDDTAFFCEPAFEDL